MMLDPNGNTSWTQDRFMVFLVLATGLHVLLFFGVSFGVSLNPVPRLADTLDVVLVQWRSEDKPDQADYLAQASQKGGGDTEERTRPSEPLSGQLPTPQEGKDPVESIEQVPATALDIREIVAVEAESENVVLETEVEQAETEQPDAAALMRQSMDMASLQPELRSERQWKSRLPRREFISANTREYEFASYMSAWVSKVERVGNLNYPSELRQKKAPASPRSTRRPSGSCGSQLLMHRCPKTSPSGSISCTLPEPGVSKPGLASNDKHRGHGLLRNKRYKSVFILSSLRSSMVLPSGSRM
jgi:protein TonB